LATGGTTAANQGYEAEAIIDAVVTDTPIFVRTSLASNDALAGSLVLNNIKLDNVPTAVAVAGGAVVLAGGSLTIDSWGQGNTFSGTSGQKAFTQGHIPAPIKASSLLNNSGHIVSRGHPQYESYAVSQFASARDEGCAGDGHTDDTDAINALLAKVRACRTLEASLLLTFICIVCWLQDCFLRCWYLPGGDLRYDRYFDCFANVTSQTDTITVPANTRLVGEAWSCILGSGSKFNNPSSPAVVVKVGDSGSCGVLEITDMIFKTRGPGADHCHHLSLC
jgi:hypothetical protein